MRESSSSFMSICYIYIERFWKDTQNTDDPGCPLEGTPGECNTGGKELYFSLYTLF